AAHGDGPPADEVLARAALVVAVAHRVDLVDVVAHGLLPHFQSRLLLVQRAAPPSVPSPLWGRCPEQVASGRPSLFLPVLGEHLASAAEGDDRRRHAGVDRELNEHLADLLLADPVAQRAADVQLELVLPAQRPEHREVEQAAGLFRQLLAAPHRAPAILRHEFLERPPESAGAFQRIPHVLPAQAGLADLQPLLEHLLVHGAPSLDGTSLFLSGRHPEERAKRASKDGRPRSRNRRRRRRPSRLADFRRLAPQGDGAIYSAAAREGACAAAIRYSIAACTPPLRCGTPASASVISTAASAPRIVRSLVSARCPMRKYLPENLPKLVPNAMSKRSSAISRNASASWPSGSSTPVIVGE